MSGEDDTRILILENTVLYPLSPVPLAPFICVHAGPLKEDSVYFHAFVQSLVTHALNFVVAMEYVETPPERPLANSSISVIYSVDPDNLST